MGFGVWCVVSGICQAEVPDPWVGRHLEVAQVLHDQRVGVGLVVLGTESSQLELQAVGRLPLLGVVALACQQEGLQRVLDIGQHRAGLVATRHVVASNVVHVLDGADLCACVSAWGYAYKCTCT